MLVVMLTIYSDKHFKIISNSHKNPFYKEGVLEPRDVKFLDQSHIANTLGSHSFYIALLSPYYNIHNKNINRICVPAPVGTYGYLTCSISSDFITLGYAEEPLAAHLGSAER